MRTTLLQGDAINGTRLFWQAVVALLVVVLLGSPVWAVPDGTTRAAGWST